jgi:hypothetical protein
MLQNNKEKKHEKYDMTVMSNLICSNDLNMVSKGKIHTIYCIILTGQKFISGPVLRENKQNEKKKKETNTF